MDWTKKTATISLGFILSSMLLLLQCKSNSSAPDNNNGGGGGGGSTQITATIQGKTITFTPAFHSGTYLANGPFGPVLDLSIEGTADAPPGADISLSGGGAISTGTFDIGSDAHSNYSFSLTYAYDTTIEGVSGEYHYSSEMGNGASVGTI